MATNKISTIFLAFFVLMLFFSCIRQTNIVYPGFGSDKYLVSVALNKKKSKIEFTYKDSKWEAASNLYSASSKVFMVEGYRAFLFYKDTVYLEFDELPSVDSECSNEMFLKYHGDTLGLGLNISTNSLVINVLVDANGKVKLIGMQGYAFIDDQAADYYYYYLIKLKRKCFNQSRLNGVSVASIFRLHIELSSGKLTVLKLNY
jgi:hypothetical protein